MRKISYEELRKYLEEILACDAFELHVQKRNDKESDYYIPYMMNDALECYLLLQKGHMTGEYNSELEEEMQVEFIKTEDGPALIFRQGRSNVFTIWFQEAFQDLQCYRYDQIGHFWITGQEHWRRLVYMIGTMHDKYNYMGEEVCNEKELKLLPLMEFAPFRYFSPIHDSLDEYYINSEMGHFCMECLVEETKNKRMSFLMQLYKVLPFKKIVEKLLIREMMHPRCNPLYELIFSRVQAASEQYPKRLYENAIETKICETRDEAEKRLKENGFKGTYPLFQKGHMQVQAMEEHPFTILESDHYNFKIQYMVSEGRGKKGNHRWIARDLQELFSRMK